MSAINFDMPSQTYKLQTTNVATGGWNDDRIAVLTQLWAKGWSASEIAKHIGGITRNAVIGKAHRLGLSGRKARGPQRARYNGGKRQTRPVQSRKINRAASKPVAQAKQAVASPVPLPEPAALKLALLDLRENTCRWPIGDPQDENFCFCGCQTSGNGPFCEYHARIAYQPYVPRSKR
jgi:GcrA cell cycle regulator